MSQNRLDLQAKRKCYKWSTELLKLKNFKGKPGDIFILLSEYQQTDTFIWLKFKTFYFSTSEEPQIMKI